MTSLVDTTDIYDYYKSMVDPSFKDGSRWFQMLITKQGTLYTREGYGTVCAVVNQL